MNADHARRVATLNLVIANADLLITWALDQRSPALFHEWVAKRSRYRALLAHILGEE